MSHDGTVTPMQEELPQEKEELIQALLLYGSTRGAAKQLNISERTAWRWQSDPLFKRRYKEERLARFERSVAIAQQTSEQLVSMLVEIAADKENNVFARITAIARALEHAERGAVIDHEERLQEIEHQLQERAGTPAAVRRLAS